MDNNKGTLDNILGILGLVSLVAIVYHAFKSINSDTDTSVISDDALKAIQEDPKATEKIREAVDDYHDNGEWNETKLESIL
ncbi:MAG: hypothetical protein ACTJGD_02710 [Mesonia hippocampi]|uniref:hypothetical protein n=1 Tax=Mesonia hippocampi TaxID=1628250 RepID=UPI003F990B28